MLAQILAFFGGIIAKVLTVLLQTPAVKEEVHVVEGKANKPSVDVYDGLYGMHDRREGKEDSPDGESSTNP